MSTTEVLGADALLTRPNALGFALPQSAGEPAAPAVAREERGVFADRIASAWEACIDAQMYLDRAFDALDDIKREAGISSHAARRVGRGKGEGGSSS